jgi:chitodextrinase
MTQSCRAQVNLNGQSLLRKGRTSDRHLIKVWISSMATTITVSTSAELYKALAGATGGETILLASGDYGNFSLGVKSGFDITFPSTVKIASASSDHPAVFTGIALNGAANLSIDNVVFDYTAGGDNTQRDRPNQVNGCTNISITNSTFDGDTAHDAAETANGYGTGIGLSVRGGEGITIQNNDFYAWHRGAVFDSTTNLKVIGNEVHDIRSDGMDYVNVQNVLIEDNYLHDFRASYASGDHRDMIQFWTSGTKTPSTDITIRGNVLDIGDGSYTQSIFMRNEMVDSGQAGKEMYYQNVVIENNTIYNGHLHGITVGETNGLVISGNSVLQSKDGSNPADSDSALWTPSIRVATNSSDVEIIGNAVATITGYSDQSGWTVKGNAFVQANNPYAPGYYGDVFIDSTLSSNDSLHHFVALPGGMLDALNAGSSTTQAATAATSGAFYNIGEVDGNGAARVFDASIMSSLLGSALKGATFQWTFGDGTKASGVTVAHSFASGGDYDVKLVVKLANGTSLNAAGGIEIAGSKVVAFDGSSHSFVAYDSGTTQNLGALAKLDGNELQLGASGTSYKVGSKYLSALKNADDVTINFTLQADKIGSNGELFRVHSAFLASVTSAGQLFFQTTQSDGSVVKMTTKSDIALNDGKSHAVSIDLDDGKLQVSIDGHNVGEIAAGNLSTSMTDLVFGNPWGKTNFVGDISAFSIDVDSGHYVSGTSILVPDPVAAPEESATSAPVPPVEPAAPVHHDLVAEAMGEVDFKLDLASLASKTGTLLGNAAVGDSSVALRGGDDYVNLGRLKDVEHSDQLAFSVDFSRQPDSGGDQRLVWNHMKAGLSLTTDGLLVQVATADQGLKGFTIKGLGLDDTEKHTAAVLIDATHDRLQVVLDDKVVLDVSNVDFDIVGAGGREWGWTLGSAWNHDFTGDVYAFSVDTHFDFIDTSGSHQTLA